MANFIDYDFLRIINKKVSVKNLKADLETSYNEMIDSIFDDFLTQKNLLKFYNHLCYIQGELAGSESLLKENNEEIDIKRYYIKKAKEIVDKQFAAVKRRLNESSDTQENPQIYYPEEEKVCWVALISGLVELAYGLAETKALTINGREMTVKEIIAYLCKMFNVEVKNGYGTFHDMKRRKSYPKAYFLNLMSKLVGFRLR